MCKSDKGRAQRIYTELLHANKRKITWKWTKDLNRHVSKEQIKISSFISFINRQKGVDLVGHQRYGRTLTHVAEGEVMENTKCWLGCGATGTPTCCRGRGKGCEHFEKVLSVSTDIEDTHTWCSSSTTPRKAPNDHEKTSTAPNWTWHTYVLTTERISELWCSSEE